jgi:hypothetical protein
MGGIFTLGMLLTAIAVVLSLPTVYLFVWCMGPAVKYWGRKWEEGRQRAERAFEERLTAARSDAFRRGRESVPPSAPAPAASAGTATGNPPEPTPQYTITGRRIR